MNSKESLIYTKYKTISMLPEEIMEAYCDKMTIEKIEALYEKVKQRFLELPEEDAQMQLHFKKQETMKKHLSCLKWQEMQDILKVMCW